MIKNKKGLIGKIILIIAIILIIIGAIMGITAYQAYSLVKTVKVETATITEDVDALIGSHDCSKISEIEISISNIKEKAESACANPLIKIAVDKIDRISVKCDDISSLQADAESKLAPIKNTCFNQTRLIIQNLYQENLTNATI